MSYFEHEGNRIFYEEIGEGKPLILLHGNTTSRQVTWVTDRFEGIKASSSITEQISIGRNYAKLNEGLCSMLKVMYK